MLLPSALVLLLAGCLPSESSAVQIPWPWIKTIDRNHDVSIQDADRSPWGVRKMSMDVGEMFFPEYWDLDGTREMVSESAERRQMLHTKDEWMLKESNFTLYPPPFRIPFALHEIHQPYHPPIFRQLHLPRALDRLLPRDFQCPADTFACTSIERPNSCCPQGLSCRSISDSGSGDVGCCVDGESCGNEVSKCADDQESCPGEQGGGCCVAGYRCAGAGCEAASTATVIVNPTVTSSRSTTSSSSTSESTSISTSTETQVTSTTSTSTSSPPTSSTTSQRSVTPIAPVRPVSGSASTTETSTGPTTTVAPTFCPIGFYACSAHYLGGCCRVGRDCSSTSCPAPSNSLVLSSNGVSIGVAPAEPTRLGEDGCALGWFRCASDGGGGCCPSGYACGESCTATGVNIGGGVTGTAKVAKDNGTSYSIMLGRGCLLASVCLSIFSTGFSSLMF